MYCSGQWKQQKNQQQQDSDDFHALNSDISECCPKTHIFDIRTILS